MSRLRKVANYNVVYDAFKDAQVQEKFNAEVKRIKEDVLDDIIGDESAERLLDNIIDRATDADGKGYDIVVDYVTNNKISEDQLPSEQEIIDILTEKVEEIVNVDDIQEAIDEMKDINDSGIEREYWDSRF